MHPTDLGVTHVTTFSIDTGNHPPIAQRPYRTNPVEEALMRKEVEALEQAGIVEKCVSPWASPAILVAKKGDIQAKNSNKPPPGEAPAERKLRLCIDLRQLNKITRKDAYPVPRVDDILDGLGKGRYFSKLDLKSAYYQVAIADEESKDKTAFVTPFGTYRFTRMPMGLVNAPAAFARLGNTIFAGLVGKCMFIYIDDIIVWGATFEEMCYNLDRVLQVLAEANLRVAPDKCEFGMQEIAILGHMVSEKGIAPDPDKIRAMVSYPCPRTQRQVRAFLGLTGFYRRFIKGYAEIAGPLTGLTSKNVSFAWGPEQQQSFEQLKQALISPPILRPPDWALPFLLYTDWSKLAVGAILAQKECTGAEYVIAYASHKLDKAQQNYAPTEGECLAVKWAVKKFHSYLVRTHFTVITDHYSLKWLLENKDLTGKLARWALWLQNYSFDIQHRKGTEHGNVDALSRMFDDDMQDQAGESGPEDPPPSLISEGTFDSPLDILEGPVITGCLLLSCLSSSDASSDEEEQAVLAPSVGPCKECHLFSTLSYTSVGKVQDSDEDSDYSFPLLHHGLVPYSSSSSSSSSSDSGSSSSDSSNNSDSESCLSMADTYTHYDYEGVEDEYDDSSDEDSSYDTTDSGDSRAQPCSHAGDPARNYHGTLPEIYVRHKSTPSRLRAPSSPLGPAAHLAPQGWLSYDSPVYPRTRDVRLWIGVEGNIGSGKTTMVTRIQDYARLQHGIAVRRESVQPFRDDLREFYAAMRDRPENPQLLSLMATALQLRILHSSSTPLDLPCITDRTPWAAQVFAAVQVSTGVMLPGHYALLSDLYSRLSLPSGAGSTAGRPDVLVYVHTPALVCMQRAGLRGRTEEVDLTLDYFQAIESAYIAAVKQLPPDSTVVVIDGSQPTEVVTSAMKTVVDVVGLRARGYNVPALSHPHAHWCTNPPSLRDFDPEAMCAAGRALAQFLHPAHRQSGTPVPTSIRAVPMYTMEHVTGLPDAGTGTSLPLQVGEDSRPAQRRQSALGRRGRPRSALTRRAVYSTPWPQPDPQPVPPDLTCEICGSAEQEERMLVCDGCNEGFHMHCLSPRVLHVPPGDWYCPHCQMLGVRLLSPSGTVMGPARHPVRAPSGRPHLVPLVSPTQSTLQPTTKHNTPITTITPAPAHSGLENTPPSRTTVLAGLNSAPTTAPATSSPAAGPSTSSLIAGPSTSSLIAGPSPSPATAGPPTSSLIAGPSTSPPIAGPSTLPVSNPQVARLTARPTHIPANPTFLKRRPPPSTNGDDRSPRPLKRRGMEETAPLQAQQAAQPSVSHAPVAQDLTSKVGDDHTPASPVKPQPEPSSKVGDATPQVTTITPPPAEPEQPAVSLSFRPDLRSEEAGGGSDAEEDMGADSGPTGRLADIWDDTLTITLLHGDPPPPGAPDSEVKRARRRASGYYFEKGILYRARTLKHPCPRQVPPPHLRSGILHSLHDDQGHLGQGKLYRLLSERFYWTGMSVDAKQHVNKCTACRSRKLEFKLPQELHPIPPSRAFERLHVDFMGPYPQSRAGNSYAIVLICPLTNWPEVEPLPDKSSANAAGALMRCISRHGCPRVVVTDQGREFEGEFGAALASLHIEHRRTSAYHPQGNGRAERTVQTILTCLRKALGEPGANACDWDSRLSEILLAIRASQHTASGYSPALLTYGRELLLPAQLQAEAAAKAHGAQLLPEVVDLCTEGSDTEDLDQATQHHLSSITATLETATPAAVDNIASAQQKQVAAYQSRRSQHKDTAEPLPVGSFVVIRVKPAHKLAPDWEGPYRLHAYDDRGTTAVVEDATGQRWTRHVSLVAPWHGCLSK
jgi:thymidylate kinase